MICKGNTHKNGAKLARYMTTPKEGEHVVFGELRGFASDDITKAFRLVHVMAEGTRCEQPLFHVQVRNPDGESLTRDQWQRVADRIEAKLGLTDQPRAIVFHINKETGHEHMHVAWSRIDTETMKAIPLPFFKERLKEVSRQIETELDLTRVKNERDGPVLAPNRDEFEEARRLGVDIKQVRQYIRDCWEHSDNGASFRAALAERGLTLAQGDRRDFVVLDHEGGLHALGKRLLGVSAAQTRTRLGDIDRDALPTIAQARESIAERIRDAKHQSMPDPDLREMAWQDALAKAAIEKEKVDRRFVEPSRELQELERQAFRDVSSIGLLHRKGDHPAPEHLSRIEKRIWTDYHNSGDPRAVLAALADHKIALAVVTKPEADRSHRLAEFAKAVGNYSPRYSEGQIVAVTEPGPIFRRDGEPVEARRVYPLNQRTTGQDQHKIDEFLKPIRNQLRGLDETKDMLNARSADRAAHWDSIRAENAQRPGRQGSAISSGISLPRPIRRQVGRTLGQSLDAVGSVMETVLAPVLTPEQKREGARETQRRQADAADRIDLSSTLARLAEERQRQKQQGQVAQQPQIDERER